MGLRTLICRFRLRNIAVAGVLIKKQAKEIRNKSLSILPVFELAELANYFGLGLRAYNAWPVLR